MASIGSRSNLQKLLDCMLNTINVINDNGEWKVIGWTKRGEINDIAFKESDASTNVTSSEINHHISTLKPALDLTKNDTFLSSQ